MTFPEQRPRRLRTSERIRALVRETSVTPGHLVYPLFVVPGEGVRREVPSMPGVYQLSSDLAEKEAREVESLGIAGVLLFGLPKGKDPEGSEGYREDSVVCEAVRRIRSSCKDLLVATDVCLCEYTSHGHCGVLEGGEVANDATLPLLARMAQAHANAGAHIVAPSDMMDGRVGVIRKALDSSGLENTVVLAYTAKYASGFFSPFREAADSTPQFGDRRSYQMDPPNVREALREAALDVAEGADILMVKPALPYLDVLRAVREAFPLPTAAYNVSGEYSMVKAAALRGWIDEARVVGEILASIRRAGADIIVTYHAKDFVRSGGTS